MVFWSSVLFVKHLSVFLKLVAMKWLVRKFTLAILICSVWACNFNPDQLIPPQWDTNFIGPLVRVNASLDDILNIGDQQFSESFSICDLLMQPNCSGSIIIPPIPSTDLPESDISYTDIYNLITLDSGIISLTIDNGLPINVTSLTIEIRNDDNSLVVGWNLDSVLSANGGSRTFSDDLQGRTLTSNFKIRFLNFSSDGSGGVVSINPNQSLGFVFDVIALKVGEVNLVPGNRFSLGDTTEFELDDGIIINSEPLTGSLNFICDNGFPAAFSVQAYFLNEAKDMVLDSLFPSGIVFPTQADSVTILTTEINEERILKMKAASFVVSRMDWVAVSDPPGLNQAILDKTDSLKITMVAEIKVRVKP